MDDTRMLGSDEIKEKKRLEHGGPPEHYYGDIVRRLFIAGAIIMLATLPFFANNLPAPFFTTIIVILIIGILAGLTNPRQFGIAVVNVVVSVVTFGVFEYYAVVSYIQNSTRVLFWTNQVLAIIFFVALYYASKTVRGMLLKNKKIEDGKSQS